MKVYISFDLEGISGIAMAHTETVKTGMDYHYSRRWAVHDINAAIEGALEAGATRVVVNDAHSSMRNLVLEDLHPEAELIAGALFKPYLNMAMLDGSFDAVFFVHNLSSITLP